MAGTLATVFVMARHALHQREVAEILAGWVYDNGLPSVGGGALDLDPDEVRELVAERLVQFGRDAIGGRPYAEDSPEWSWCLRHTAGAFEPGSESRHEPLGSLATVSVLRPAPARRAGGAT